MMQKWKFMMTGQLLLEMALSLACLMCYVSFYLSLQFLYLEHDGWNVSVEYTLGHGEGELSHE